MLRSGMVSDNQRDQSRNTLILGGRDEDRILMDANNPAGAEGVTDPRRLGSFLFLRRVAYDVESLTSSD